MLPCALKVWVGDRPRAAKYASMPNARDLSSTVGTRNPSRGPFVSIQPQVSRARSSHGPRHLPEQSTPQPMRKCSGMRSLMTSA
eukprot:15457499-Alexandrium_andersonii.AAC.1